MVSTEPRVPELFFCRDLQGYGWCVRKGDYVNVGLGRLDPRSLPAATTEFMAFLRSAGRIAPDSSWRWRGHSYVVNAAPRGPIVDEGAMLIGDAAGVADPQSGEGIRQAIESGLLAAETIIDGQGSVHAAAAGTLREPSRRAVRPASGVRRGRATHSRSSQGTRSEPAFASARVR